MRRFYIWVLASLLLACQSPQPPTNTDSSLSESEDTQKDLSVTFQKYVDEEGNIRVPADYKDWTYLGTWSLADPNEAAASGLHVVYTQAETADYYQEFGIFPDGAVLVKELLNTETNSLTTGIASRATEVTGFFVMVKDRQNRFDQNPLWGEGWGWAYFEFTDMVNTSSTNYKTDCLGCHIPVKNKDWVYVEGYPRLNASLEN